MKVFDWFKSIFDKARKAFNRLFKMAFPIARQIILGSLSSIATKAVLDLKSTNLSNEEKRNEAFKKIKDHAVKEGLDVRDSLINVLIEMAVLSFKREF